MTLVLSDFTRASAAEKVRELFLKMHGSDRRATSRDGSDLESFITQSVEKLRVLDFEAGECERLERYFRSEAANWSWSLGLQHGDFTTDNIFVLNGEITGVIDWEYATDRGVPVLDVIAYVESMQRMIDTRTTATENLVRLANWDWPSGEEIDLLKAIYRRFDIDLGPHRFLCHLAWLQHCASHLDTANRFDPVFVERWTRPMLATLTTA